MDRLVISHYVCLKCLFCGVWCMCFQTFPVPAGCSLFVVMPGHFASLLVFCHKVTVDRKMRKLTAKNNNFQLILPVIWAASYSGPSHLVAAVGSFRLSKELP